MKRSTILLLTAGICVLLAGLNANFFFRQPYYEFWDLAANSLSILRAKHFVQIYGPYSRYGFYHPGAGYFYVDAFGEWLFHDALHVVPAPYNGQLLMHLCLMAGLFVAGLAVFTHWLPVSKRWVFVCLALSLAILHFGSTSNLPSFVEPLGGPTAFLSNWSAHFLVLPFFCLLAAGTSVACGRARDLSLLVIAGGFLVHAHVAQPLFVVPVALLAYGGLVVNAARRRRAGDALEPAGAVASARRSLTAAWRESPRAHVWAGAFLGVFLLPIAIDVCKGHDSNLALILRHLHAQASSHKPLVRSATYFLQFAAYAPYQQNRLDFGRYDVPGFLGYLHDHVLLYEAWLLIALLVSKAPLDLIGDHFRRRRAAASNAVRPAGDEAAFEAPSTQGFLAAGAGFTALAVALSLYWGTRQEGAMFYYNSWFNFGILYFAALVAAGVFCTRGFRFVPPQEPTPARRPSAWRRFVVPTASAGAVALLGYLSAPRMRIHDRYIGDGNRALHEGIVHAMAVSDAEHPGAPKFLAFPVPVWSHAAAVGLQLARAGEPFTVPDDWNIVFGEEHGWNARLGKSSQANFCPWYVLLTWPPRPGMAPDAPVFTLHPGVSLALTPPGLALTAVGDTADINFAPDGHAGDFILGGWGLQEPFGRWSDEPWAALSLRPSMIKGNSVEVAVTMLPFAGPISQGKVARQRLSVFFNGEPLGPEQIITQQGMFSFRIPATSWNKAAASADPLAMLAFEFPDAVSPASFDPSGRSQDFRRLGIHFSLLHFRVE